MTENIEEEKNTIGELTDDGQFIPASSTEAPETPLVENEGSTEEESATDLDASLEENKTEEVPTKQDVLETLKAHPDLKNELLSEFKKEILKDLKQEIKLPAGKQEKIFKPIPLNLGPEVVVNLKHPKKFIVGRTWYDLPKGRSKVPGFVKEVLLKNGALAAI